MENLITQSQDIHLNELRQRIQNFVTLLNKDVDGRELQTTPDGKASYLPIDFIETKLDEFFFGMWKTEDFKWSAFQNEVVGSIQLSFMHPVTGEWITRTGAGSYTVMVDALSKEDKETMTSKQRNMYATNIENKKPNAFELGFPKLKTDCIKNAAISIGNAFGRNVNRKYKDVYTPILKSEAAKEEAKIKIEQLKNKVA